MLVDCYIDYMWERSGSGAIAQTVRIGEGYFGGCTHSSIETVISDMAAIAV